MVIKKKVKLLGTLEIRPCKGRDLRVVQKIGKQDPFLQFELGNTRKRTKADKNGGQKPTWNERISFEVPEGVHKVAVKCYDQNLREHAFIGEREIDFSPAITYYQLDNWFELKDKGDPAGEVYLEFTFFPVDGQKNPPPLPYASSPVANKTGVPVVPPNALTAATPTSALNNQKAQASPKSKVSPEGTPKQSGSPIHNPEYGGPKRNNGQPLPANNKLDSDRPSSSLGDSTPHIGSAGPSAKPLPNIPPSSRSNSIYSSTTPSQNGSPQPARRNPDSSEHAEQSNRASQYSQAPSFTTPYPPYPYPMSPDQSMYLPGHYYPSEPYAYGYPPAPGTPFPPICPDPAVFAGYPIPEGYMPPYPDMPVYDPSLFPDHFPMPEEFVPPMGVYCDEYGVPLPPPPMDFMPYPAMVPPGCYVHPEEEKQK